MGLILMDLERVRVLMCGEMGNDFDHGALYLSKRLTPHGVARYPELLREAARNGDDVDLEKGLRRPGMLKRREQVWRGGHLITRAVPRTAATILAEGEFNRYYIRGVCPSG